MTNEEKIERLRNFKQALNEWENIGGRAQGASDVRSYINQNLVIARRLVIEAKCGRTITIGPPPAVGGLIIRDADPFYMIFDPPYGRSLIPDICDFIDQALGVYSALATQSKSIDIKENTILSPTVASKNKSDDFNTYSNDPLPPKPPEILQKIRWIWIYGRKYWIIILIASILITVSLIVKSYFFQ